MTSRVPNFPVDAFAGTAEYYARYRLPYPESLIDDLRNRAGVTGNGRLLDLGCGPGRVAIAMAPFFREVWAIDPEPEMIQVGREKAGTRGVTNLNWMITRAEDLEAPKDAFELITIGEAFHRLDQRLIARRGMEWLQPGGGLAILWYVNYGRGDVEWQSMAAKVVRKWTGREPRVVTNIPSAQKDPDFEEVLQTAGFEDVASYEFPTPHVWTLDDFVGYLYSTSGVSKRVLGDRADGFEADLRRTLLEYDAAGRYPETAMFGYILARRPV